MLEDLKPGEDAEAAVEPATVGNGVQMTAEDERAFGRTGERHPVVPCGVVVMFDGKAGELLLEPCTCTQPDGRPCNTLCSVLVRCERTKLFKIRDDCACIDHGKLGYQCMKPTSIS